MDARSSTADRPSAEGSTSLAATPTTDCSAAVARTGVDPMPNSPIAQRSTRPSPSTSTATHGAGDGEVTVAPRHLLDGEAAPAGPDREPDAGEDLVVVERGRPGAGEELRRRDRPPAADRHGLELGVESERHRRQLRRRIGVGDRPADRAAVADLEMADQRDGARQEGHEPGDFSVALDRGLRGRCPDPHGTVRGARCRGVPRRGGGRRRVRTRRGASTSSGMKLWPPARTLASSRSVSSWRTPSIVSGAW